MKTLLRRIKRSLIFRLGYRLTCWINYPTPRERMWGMYDCGKQAGKREALKTLPIVQVQPKQAPTPVEVHLPPGEWTRLYRDAHGLHKIALEPPVELPQDDSWLNSKPRKPFDPYDTTESPAIVALLHQEKNAR